MFLTENRAYFKDFHMREMDEKLGDIYSLICGESFRHLLSWPTDILQSTEKEIEIVYDLAQKIQRYEDVLVDASDVCGEIDRQVVKE